MLISCMTVRRLMVLATLVTLAGPAIAAPPLEAYGHLPAVEAMNLSPSGERFATVALMGDHRRLLVGTTDGKLLQDVGLGNEKVSAIWWIGDNHVLLMTHSTFKAPFDFAVSQVELSSVINLTVSTGKLAVIFEKNPAIGDVVLGYFGSAAFDGHTYGYFGGVTYLQTRKGDYIADTSQGYVLVDLYQVDLDSGKARRIARGRPNYRGWAIGADGSILAHEEYDRVNAVWRLYAGKDHDKLLMEVPTPTVTPDLMSLGRTPGTVLVFDPTADRDVMVEVNIADGKRQELPYSEDGRWVLRDRDSNLLLGFATDNPDFPDVYSVPLRSRMKGTVKAFPGYHVRINSYSRTFDHLIAFTDGGDDSGTYWRVNISAGKADPIGYAYPKVRSADVGPTRLFNYKAADGLALDGVLTLPPGHKAQKLPVVVLPHGGPIGVYDMPGFDWWAQAYASAGYAVFQPNYRGSGGQGAGFRKAGYGEWGGKILGDIADGLAALAAEGIVDPRRACIVGASYGGYAALAGVTVQQGLYRCAVAVAGPADLPAFLAWHRQGYGSNSESMRFFREAVGVDGAGGVDATSRYSPSALAARADAPILLIHGVDDSVVPIAQSEAMAAALKKADKPFEFIRMKGEDHWLSGSKTRTEMLKASVKFVERYNPVE